MSSPITNPQLVSKTYRINFKTPTNFGTNDPSLTFCQNKAYQAIIEWVSSSIYSLNHNLPIKPFLLLGSAGTGKTYLISVITKTLLEGGLCVSLCAPTHIAKEVMSNKLDQNLGVWLNNVKFNATCHPNFSLKAQVKNKTHVKYTSDSYPYITTIHSILGLKPSFNIEKYDGKNLSYAKASSSTSYSPFNIIIVDESSMIPKLFREMLENTIQDKHNTLILYVGDDCQLPPPNETKSSVFNIMQECLSESKLRYARLNTIVRQSDNHPSLLLLNCLRYDILQDSDSLKLATDTINSMLLKNEETLLNEYYRKTLQDAINTKKLLFKTFLLLCFDVWLMTPEPGVTGAKGFYIVTKQEDFDNKLKTYNKNTDKCLAFTNNCVSSLNSMIRRNQVEKGIIDSSQLISKGEKILSYKSVKKDIKVTEGSYSNPRIITIDLLVNSKEYEVLQVNESTMRYKLNNSIFYDSMGTYMLDLQKLGLSKDHLNKYQKVECYDCVIDKKTPPIRIPKQDSETGEMTEGYKLLLKVHDNMLEYINNLTRVNKSDEWKKYFLFRERMQLFGNNSLTTTSKDVDYAYALTIHKSQGSTYQNVFINAQDIRNSNNANLMLRLLYTSLSRATHKSVILV